MVFRWWAILARPYFSENRDKFRQLNLADRKILLTFVSCREGFRYGEKDTSLKEIVRAIVIWQSTTAAPLPPPVGADFFCNASTELPRPSEMVDGDKART